MFPWTKIIAVDDNLSELGQVVQSLRQLGLACVSYNYPDETPERSFSGLRIVFLDINLIGGTSPHQDANVFAAPISILERIIGDTNGPYALITWTDTGLHEKLMERLRGTKSLEFRQPFFARPLEKAEYAKDAEKLKGAIQEIIAKTPSFGALLDWEARVGRAGQRVLYEIQSSSSSLGGDDAAEKLDRMLSKLAVSAFGENHVEAHRFEAVNEALLPILNDALNVEFFSEAAQNDVWEKAVTKHAEENQIENLLIARLNSAVIFEPINSIKPYRRGAVPEVPEAWLAGGQFVERFGATPNDLAVSVLKLKGEADVVRWVLIQAQAACDFAQQKIGPMPYLLAAVVPAWGKKRSVPASVWIGPPLAPAVGVSDTDYQLEILHSAVCQMTRQVVEDTDFKVLGRLKDQVVGAIGHVYHAHGSRPGFISFR